MQSTAFIHCCSNDNSTDFGNVWLHPDVLAYLQRSLYLFVDKEGERKHKKKLYTNVSYRSSSVWHVALQTILLQHAVTSYLRVPFEQIW